MVEEMGERDGNGWYFWDNAAWASHWKGGVERELLWLPFEEARLSVGAHFSKRWGNARLSLSRPPSPCTSALGRTQHWPSR